MKKKIKIKDRKKRKTLILFGALLITGVLLILLSIPEVNASIITGFEEIYYSGNFFLNISDNLRIATNNLVRMYFQAGGNIGIRTTTPSNSLDINGDLMVYDEIKQSSNQSVINRIVNSGRKEIFTSTGDGLSQGAVPINTWMTPRIINYSAGYEPFSFYGGVFDGQNIWLVPYYSIKLVKVNPATGEMTNYSADYGGGSAAFAGAVFDGQNIWLIPSNSDFLVKLNPATGEMTNYSADYGGESAAFVGAVFDGQNIWLVPYYSTTLVKLNPATGEMTNYSADYGTTTPFFGGVFDGQNIWLVPYSSTKLVKLNPATGEMTNYSAGYGGSAFQGGVFDGQNIWLIPANSDFLVKLNPATGEMTNYSHNYAPGQVAFVGAVFDGQNIWLTPYFSTKLVKVNPATGVMTDYPADYGEGAGWGSFSGTVFDGQNIWLIPYYSTKLVKVHPQEFGIEGLSTGGDATIGGNLLVKDILAIGNTNITATFNHIGNSSSSDDALNSSRDLYIEGNLEVNGIMYLTGNASAMQVSDVAENLLTEAGRESVLCEARKDCVAKEYTKELDYGDVVCINPITAQTIEKCTEANSEFAIGTISDTSIINMGNNGKYSYPVAVAGIVWTKATNENGDISPGDLLVSSSKPGYAMKNNEPAEGTVIGESFDFCDKKECKILMFVALS